MNTGPTGKASGSPEPGKGTGAHSQAHNPDSAVSVVHGHVRIAQASGWADARGKLRTLIDDVYDSLYKTDRSDQYQEQERARAALGVIDHGMLFATERHAWADSMRYAIQGLYGVTIGDLAVVQDFHNGSRYAWTIAVKCKVTHITATQVTVRITGESLQFRRHSVITVPVSYIRPRRKGTR
jgi:hypothetical protein